jgi:SPW repeat-containing protein
VVGIQRGEKPGIDGAPMRRGLIPLNVHAAVEPLAAIVLIASPWIFGFSDRSSAKIVMIVVGVIMLLSGMMTDWRQSPVRLIPLRVHFMTDLLLGIVLVISPFIRGFSSNGAATRFAVIFGALELLTALTTHWEPVDDYTATHLRAGSRTSL